ncbi:FAD-dependent monooxygenase [Bradyrhizobium rifense]|uniref:FAD-dependent monooxygenase n=1 Tax=Bradyrhizobium rifense TaxID=515499 RepID=UPI001FE5DB38|nr:FAD-dependent monooxygenase [Bradyrhizobium rifense]
MSGLRVAVIGGGIGGCSAALALQRVGCIVDVYEQVPVKGEVGAGIQISPNASRLLNVYGLAQQLEAIAVRPSMTEARRWDDGRILSREQLGPAMERDFGAPYYHVHRADLLNIISGAIPQHCLHMGRRCIGLVQHDDRVEVMFEGGSTVEADVVVGADGIHSAVRRELFGAEQPRFSGNVAYRGVVPVERIADLGIERKSTNWMGPGGHFVHYFVSGGRYLNFVAVVEQAAWQRESWNDRGDVAEAQQYYEGWHPQLHAILRAVDDIYKWALFDRDPLPSWTLGRATLLGDACHPMLPYMAQGAAQAIEDGAVLAACLSSVPDLSVEDALKRYEAIRKPRASEIQALARRNAQTFHLHDGPEQQARDGRMAAHAGGRDVAAVSPARSMIFAYDAMQEQVGPAAGDVTPKRMDLWT